MDTQEKSLQAIVKSGTSMDSVTATTPEELKKAIKEKHNKIIVTGKLAEKVKKAKKIKKLSPAVLTMIGGLVAVDTAAVGLAPETGGASFLVAAPINVATAAVTGLSFPVLAVIAIVGLTTISILFDEYTRVEIGSDIIFERKRSKED